VERGGSVGPPDRRFLWCARGLFAAFLVSGILLVVQTTDDRVTTTTMEAPMETFRADGMGPVVIGMTWPAALAAGVKETGGQDGCVMGDYRGVTVYGGPVVTGLAAVGRGVLTDRSVGVGTPESEARGIYPSGVGDQVVVVVGRHELVLGLRDGKVAYMWARLTGQAVVGC
jgi:hypothetical protein